MLDAMAVAGGRPLPPSAPQRFYDVQSPEDLDDALISITDSIARCVFTFDQLTPDDLGVIAIDNVEIQRDTTRENGWDYTGEGEITLFGSACGRAGELTSLVQGGTLCDEP